MVLTYWVFYGTVFFLLAYLGVIAAEKSKKMFSKAQNLDSIEEKYEQLRKARREMLVLLNNLTRLATLLLGTIMRRKRKRKGDGEADIQDR